MTGPLAGSGGDALASGLLQLQRRQLERAAAQAEQRALALGKASRAARSEAEQALERSRSLQLAAGQARSEAGEARRGLRSSDALQQIGERVSALRFVAADGDSAPTAPAGVTTPTAAIAAYTAEPTPPATGAALDTRA